MAAVSCCSCLPGPGKAGNVDADECNGGISHWLGDIAGAAVAQGGSNRAPHNDLTDGQLDTALDQQKLATEPADDSRC